MCAAFHRHFGIDYHQVTTGPDAWPVARLAAYIRELDGDGYATWETHQVKNLLDETALHRWAFISANAEKAPPAPDLLTLTHFNAPDAVATTDDNTCVPGDENFLAFFGQPIYLPSEGDEHAHDSSQN